ncbi:hypothetical protein D3C86_1565720 [compost metagenome]
MPITSAETAPSAVSFADRVERVKLSSTAGWRLDAFCTAAGVGSTDPVSNGVAIFTLLLAVPGTEGGKLRKPNTSDDSDDCPWQINLIRRMRANFCSRVALGTEARSRLVCITSNVSEIVSLPVSS